MPARLSHALFTCVEDGGIRERLNTSFQGSMLARPELTQYGAVAPQQCTLAEAEKRLGPWLDAAATNTALLLSDGLVDEGGLSAAARALFADFGERLYTTIAVMRRPRRILDIDRALPWSFTDDILARVLRLGIARLTYLAPPTSQVRPKVRIRPIATETELCNYFKLRHQVYTPMSYLEELIEQDSTEMDIDWWDTQSIHLGAFTEGDVLTGTARVITTDNVSSTQREMTLEVASQDPVLEDRVIYAGAILAPLPVFQSDNHFDGAFTEAMHAMVRRGLRFAELSRVIVHPDYRGAGISLELVRESLAAAQQYDVYETFLECLPLHERLYAKAGFRPVPQARGSVYGVDRTMIVMHRPLAGSIVKGIVTKNSTRDVP